MPQPKLAIMNMRTIKVITLRKIALQNWHRLMNTTRKQLLKSLRNISIPKKREKILSGSIKSNTRPKCAETGNSLENANSKINAPLLMEITNLWKKCTCLQTTKPSLVSSSIPHLIAHTAIDASFFTLNLIFTAKNLLTTNLFSLKMLDYLAKERTLWKKETTY